MIKSLKVDNFKSLVGFTIELAKFNCIVGLNGAGKSTVLQALDFVSQLMVGDIQEWLDSRNWEAADLNSKLTKKSNIDFTVKLHVADSDVEWSGSFNRSSLSCTKETIVIDGVRVLFVEDASYVFNGKRHDIVFEYQGSILSRLKENDQWKTLKDVKEMILSIRSLDLISPELLRSQTRTSDGKLGLGGQRLSAFIHESGLETKQYLKQQLAAVYPQLDDVITKSLRSGWKQLEIAEHYGSRKLSTTARHVNDGMLRLMAILLQLNIGKAFLLFDEIENGINPELIEFLIDHLVDTDDQVLVTTHSPMILNFMEDDVAKQGVHYLYKTTEGYTRAVRLFAIPSMAKKLEFIGPGEAFIDTELSRLAEEISDVNMAQA